MAEGEGHWENLATALSEGRVKPGMRIEPYYGPQVHAAVIRAIKHDEHTGRPYIEIEPGRHFYSSSSFPFYRVDLDDRADSNEKG
ncbi:MAG: hypothetical protein HYT73_04455 [Candidatus Aenigmarchaeota archaeon]|nr:hypothetical protein [Candidatus Aenigmarchaeota archaeon]